MLVLDFSGKKLVQFIEERLQIPVLEFDRHFPVLNRPEFEDFIDERIQPVRISFYQLQLCLNSGTQLVVRQNFLQRAENEGQRSLQFV